MTTRRHAFLGVAAGLGLALSMAILTGCEPQNGTTEPEVNDRTTTPPPPDDMMNQPGTGGVMEQPEQPTGSPG